MIFSKRFAWMMGLWIGCLTGYELHGADPQAPHGFNPSAGEWTADRVYVGRDVRAFDWDSRGRLWLVKSSSQGLKLGILEPEKRRIPSVAQFVRSEGEPVDLVFHGETAYLAHGRMIERIDVSGSRPRVLKPWVVSEADLGRGQRLGQVSWGPDGLLYATETHGGVGRFKRGGKSWEWFSQGAGGTGGIHWDEHGNLFVGDESGTYYIAPGLEFHGEKPRTDWGIPMEVPPVWAGKVSATLVYGGDAWPEENRGTLLVADAESRKLRQIRLVEKGAHFQGDYWRDLAGWSDEGRVVSLRNGPDGQVWILLQVGRSSELIRLCAGKVVGRTTNLSASSSLQLAGELESDNAWHRSTALQLLSERRDLPGSRGLHASTRVHVLMQESTNARTRLMALWALHGMEMLEDDHLGNTLKDPDPWVLAWLSRLAGERQSPTKEAFEVLVKHAKHTNAMVRSATMVGARQFVSGELVRDTKPVIPIREVFTGGIMSGLWFATLEAKDPVMNQQYWNALRPISEFDPVHPLGFFEDEPKKMEPLGIFVIRKMAGQLIKTTDMEKRKLGLRAMAKIHPISSSYRRAALEGLVDGLSIRQSQFTDEEEAELEKLRPGADESISGLLEVLLRRIKSER